MQRTQVWKCKHFVGRSPTRYGQNHVRLFFFLSLSFSFFFLPLFVFSSFLLFPNENNFISFFILKIKINTYFLFPFQRYYWRSPDGEELITQKGIFRTNCMDCLDRTNVVQVNFGLFFSFFEILIRILSWRLLLLERWCIINWWNWEYSVHQKWKMAIHLISASTKVYI